MEYNPILFKEYAPGEYAPSSNGTKWMSFKEGERQKWGPMNELGEREEIDLYQDMQERIADGRATFQAYVAPPLSEYEIKLQGIEIEGVMCSATSEDQWGLGSIIRLVELGYDFNFEFKNGTILNINPNNLQSFLSQWIGFRETFFGPPQ